MRKKLLVAGLAVAALVAGGATTASASDGNPEGIASRTLGQATQQMTSNITTNGVSVAPARANGGVRSLAADVDGGKAVVAVMDSGNEARFDLGLPAGASLEQQPDGTIAVATLSTDAKATVDAIIKTPWAKDASGRSLNTSYTVEGNTLVQHVDTTNAQYPVVADPSIVGWGFYTCCAAVVYIQWSKSETKNLDKSIGQGALAAAGAACSSIPYLPAKAACLLIVGYKVNQFLNAVSSAAADGRCLKARVPYEGDPGSQIAALWFYTHTC